MSLTEKSYSITFDIDWAPDFAILYCLDLLDKAGVGTTFFATHQTDINSEIEMRGHTLGIHPNFLPGSSHGTEVASIVENCLTFAPNARSVRTHSLFQSSPTLYEMFGKFPQLKLDVSLLMHRSPHAHKCTWAYEGVSFERLLYNWEDDQEFYAPNFACENNIFFGDLTVCDFHPIHIFLNSSNGSEYSALKERTKVKPMSLLSKDSALSFRNLGIGVDTHFQKLIYSEAKSVKLEDI